MKVVSEPAWAVRRIMEACGEPEEYVVACARAFRDSVDELFREGWSILAPPLTLAYVTDRVFDAVLDGLPTATEAQIDALFVGDQAAVAQWLGLPPDDYAARPVASEMIVLARACEVLGTPNGPEIERAVAVLRAWLDTFAGGRRYAFGSVGLERDLEQWLIEHPETLQELGYAVGRVRQQMRLPDGRVPDLVYDLDGTAGPSATLVVELKAVPGSRQAVRQLAGYVSAVRGHQVREVPVLGLLVADGFSPGTEEYAREHHVATATLAALGYRAELVARRLVAPPNINGSVRTLRNAREALSPRRNQS